MKTYTTPHRASGTRISVTADPAGLVVVDFAEGRLVLSPVEAEEIARLLRAAARPSRRSGSRTVSEMTPEEAAARWHAMRLPAGSGGAS